MFTKVFAADVPLGRIGETGGTEGFGPWGFLGGDANISSAALRFTEIISRVIGVMTIIAGIWFIFQLIGGGYSYLTAGGEPKKMGDATSKITSGLIGLVVIVAAYAIIHLLGEILGFDILNPQVIIEKLRP